MFSIIFEKVYFNSLILNKYEKKFMNNFMIILDNMKYDETIITLTKLYNLLDINYNDFSEIWISEKWFKKIIWFLHPTRGISPYNKYNISKYKFIDLNKYLTKSIIKNDTIIYIKPKLNEIPLPSKIIKCFKINDFICEPCIRPNNFNPTEDTNEECAFCKRKAYSWIKTSNKKWHLYCQKPIIYQ
jgi:hypothetical protein